MKEVQELELLIDYSIEYQRRIPSFYMYASHAHNQLELFYLKAGVCTYYTDDGIFNLEAGDLMVIPAEVRHRTRYKGVADCERYVLQFSLSDLPSGQIDRHHTFFSHLNTSTKLVLAKDSKDLIASIFHKLYTEYSQPDAITRELSSLYLYELFLSLERYGMFIQEHTAIHSVISNEIEDACFYIAKNYSNTITLTDIAQFSNLSPTYFSKRFKKETGSTFVQYLNAVRLQKACQFLLTTDYSITNIATRCGFNSANYFKDVFYKKFTCSPRTYQHKLRTSKSKP